MVKKKNMYKCMLLQYNYNPKKPILNWICEYQAFIKKIIEQYLSVPYEQFKLLIEEYMHFQKHFETNSWLRKS